MDELYQRYLADPGSVDMAWWNFFADYQPPAGSALVSGTSAPTGGTAAPPRGTGPGDAGTGAAGTRGTGTQAPGGADRGAPGPGGRGPGGLSSDGAGRDGAGRDGADARTGAPATGRPGTDTGTAPPSTGGAAGQAAATAGGLATTPDGRTAARPDEAEIVRLRGAAARTAVNMAGSLTVPTATSVRGIPAKLLIDNRIVINNHLARGRGGKVSFTHLIGFAIIKALAAAPEMNNSYTEVNGKPAVVQPEHINLGLAIDVTAKDGSRQLLVPAVKAAEGLDFRHFWMAYEDIVRRARTGKLTVEDYAGTTISLTNPGTIGTEHSVPRLMSGQGCIVGVGAMEYPPEYQGAADETMTRLAISKTVTLTSTYDHRIIQGAQSGDFLRRIHALLLGEDGFYDAVFKALQIPYEPVRWERDISAGHEEDITKSARVHELIHAYRVRGHLMADTDPLEYKQRKHPDLDINQHGLTLWDLEREFATGGFGGKPLMKLRDILGVGALEYPAEWQGASEETLNRNAVSKILTLTSTYDHRVIQGAQSGEFLRLIHRLILGEDGFYDDFFRSLRIPYEPVRWVQDIASTHEDEVGRPARVLELIHAYRVRGHLMADTNPLEFEMRRHPDLDVVNHGLTLWDLDREFATGGFGGKPRMKLRDILGVLRDSYCRTIGVEYMHIQDPEERRWIQASAEVPPTRATHEEQIRILGRLNVAEAFETFLQTKYVGQKRFSLEGGESLIPLLDTVISEAADANLDEA
ncbi:MAG TPA: 2-oxo acid dehydrogenase subunit E2, partial [Streptosporangiaceae bacterium]|nr:2-oxo acid dehydrogenase subunit E2 [Streptosporangiaceae bacterium]